MFLLSFLCALCLSFTASTCFLFWTCLSSPRICLAVPRSFLMIEKCLVSSKDMSTSLSDVSLMELELIPVTILSLIRDDSKAPKSKDFAFVLSSVAYGLTDFSLSLPGQTWKTCIIHLTSSLSDWIMFQTSALWQPNVVVPPHLQKRKCKNESASSQATCRSNDDRTSASVSV